MLKHLSGGFLVPHFCHLFGYFHTSYGDIVIMKKNETSLHKSTPVKPLSPSLRFWYPLRSLLLTYLLWIYNCSLDIIYL